MAEPHICNVNWQTSDPQQEWVQVANGGLLPVAATGLEITDYTRLQLNTHIYRFPATTENTMLTLGTFESAIVYTGQGQNRWHIDDNGKRWLLLFMGRAAPIWNNTGDVVYLRNPDGTFVDTFTLGDPPRHPNGH
jgi:hypothetical protein